MSKRKTHRPRMLTSLELEILRFLWKWKLANFMTLKTIYGGHVGTWRFYGILRRLTKEGFVKDVLDGTLRIPLLTLQKKGFEAIAEGLGPLEQVRFQPQAVVHDYWASVIQLGDYVLKIPAHVQLISEQEINSKHPDLLPDCLPNSKAHVPDGYTILSEPKKKRVVAFEVELSQKTMARYEEMINFLDREDDIDVVLWLCADDHLVQRITQKIVGQRRRRPGIHNFSRLEDVIRAGWGALILWGDHTGKPVRSITCQDPIQEPYNPPPTTHQPKAMSIFLSSLKSPKGSMASAVG